MRNICNPSYCCDCRWWFYACTLPDGEPCGNSITTEQFLRTAHTREDVKAAIKATLEDIKKNRKNA